MQRQIECDRVINGVSYRFAAAGPKFRYKFILLHECLPGFMPRFFSLSLANPKRMGALTLLKRRSGVYDKYPTDKLWACNGNIAGYRINLARELIACFKNVLPAPISRPRRSTVIIMDLECNDLQRINRT